VAATALSFSSFLPWYRAPSGEELCDRLIGGYVASDDVVPNCRLQGNQPVDLTVFPDRMAAMIVLGIGLLIGLHVTLRWGRAEPLALAAGVAVVLTLRLTRAPLYGDELTLHYPVLWGAWAAATLAGIVAVAAVLLHWAGRQRFPAP
jgi:hypothetical protein